MKLEVKQGWALAALALHIIPLVLIWAQWQQWRLDSAAAPSVGTIEVRFYPQASTAPTIAVTTEDENSSVAPLATTLAGDIPVPNSAPDLPQVNDSQNGASLPSPASYLNASELDVRPQPTIPLTIPFPDATLSEEMVTGVLVLYIGLDGKVDKVEVMDSTLPPLFEQVARESFINAVMHPGMKDGKAVRSSMKVLVEFESRPAY